MGIISDERKTKNLCANIRFLRIWKRLTEKEMAQLLDMSLNSLRKWSQELHPGNLTAGFSTGFTMRSGSLLVK